MAQKKRVIYHAEETLSGRDIRSKEWHEFSAKIDVSDSSKQPVSLVLTFLGTHPFLDVPHVHRIKADSLSGAFFRVMRFLKKHGMEYCQ